MSTIVNPVNAHVPGLQAMDSSGNWNGRTLTAGMGISIANGSGVSANPIISATSGGFVWSDQNANFNPAAQNGYFVIATLTATLPAAPSNGDTIKFFVDGAFVLTIQASGTQKIQISANVSSAGGTQVSTATGDSCILVYRVTNNQWEAISFVGTWNFT